MAIKDKLRKPFIEDNDTNIFIGLDLPIRRGDGKDGYFASTTTTIEAIKNNIKNLLLTQKGERLMYPNFGMGLRRFLFEPFRDEINLAIQDEIIESFKYWLPFVIIRDILIKMSADENTMSVNIDFSITQDPTALNSIEVSLQSTSGEVGSSTGGY